MRLNQVIEQKHLVLFDGHCNLCNSSVQFIIKRDRKRKFVFSSLTWPAGQAVMQTHPHLSAQDSIILVTNQGVYTKSSAALRIAVSLGSIWPIMGVFRIVPKPLRDLIYDWIARNRYRWFGKRESCMVPDPNLNALFISGSVES